MASPIQSTSFLTSDGVRLHVLEACPPGANPQASTDTVIAFVPGWSMPADVWHEQLAAFSNWRCAVALDPRGQGESDIPDMGYTIERRAADVCEFVARYPRVVLVGWSLGALEALECVHRYGHGTIDGIVLVDSSVGEDPPPEPPPGPSFRDRLREDRRATVTEFVESMFGATRDAAALTALSDSALRMPLHASLSLFPSHVPRERWRDIAHAFPKPLFYMVSDQYATQAESLQAHRPATQIAIFEQAGHALFADHPDQFTALLEGFVAHVAQGSR